MPANSYLAKLYEPEGAGHVFHYQCLENLRSLLISSIDTALQFQTHCDDLSKARLMS